MFFTEGIPKRIEELKRQINYLHQMDFLERCAFSCSGKDEQTKEINKIHIEKKS